MSSFFDGMASGLASGFGSFIASKANQRAQRKMQDRQNEFNLRLWNAQNEYNSPRAQMSRLKSAGLNPDLVFSDGLQNIAQNAPRASEANTPQMDNPLSGFQNFALNKAQIDMMRSQAHKLDAEATRISQITPFEVDKLTADTSLAKAHTTLVDGQLKMIDSNISVNLSQIGLNSANSKQILKSIEFAQQELNLKKEAIQQGWQSIQQGWQKLSLEDKYTSAMCVLGYSQADAARAAANLSKQQLFEAVQTFSTRLESQVETLKKQKVDTAYAQKSYENYQKYGEKKLQQDLAEQKERISKAKWDNNGFNRTLDSVGKVAGAIRDIGIGVAAIKGAMPAPVLPKIGFK